MQFPGESAATARFGARRSYAALLYLLGRVEGIVGEMGLPVGHLSRHERRSDPLVQHYQLAGGGVLPVR